MIWRNETLKHSKTTKPQASFGWRFEYLWIFFLSASNLVTTSTLSFSCCKPVKGQRLLYQYNQFTVFVRPTNMGRHEIQIEETLMKSLSYGDKPHQTMCRRACRIKYLYIHTKIQICPHTHIMYIYIYMYIYAWRQYDLYTCIYKVYI